VDLIVEVSGWMTAGDEALLEQVFAACESSLPASDISVDVVMPLYDSIRRGIEETLERRPPDIAQLQRRELAHAADAVGNVRRAAASVLKNAMRLYGGRTAARACVQLVRLGAGEIIGRLASFQTPDTAIADEAVDGYNLRRATFSVCRALYGDSNLLRVTLTQETVRRSWRGWLQADRVPGNYFASTDIDAATWATDLLPQFALAHALSFGHEVEWTQSREIQGYVEDEVAENEQQKPTRPDLLAIQDRTRYTARLCLNAITDPPTRRIGPTINLAPGSSDAFLRNAMLGCIADVEQTGEREWAAPSIWHAVLWLRDVAAWNRSGRPNQDRLSKSFTNTPPGAFLFRGQRNVEWPLLPSLLRRGADDRRRYAAAVFRFLAATQQVARRAEMPPMSVDAFVAAAQHYGLPTWLLDFSVDPLSAAFFASDGASFGDQAVIYWLSTAAAARHGAEIILAPFWVERLYAQRGCFVNRGSLFETGDPPAEDPLLNDCFRIVFPASRELAESEYGDLDHAIYPESPWMTAALQWALTSADVTAEPLELASQLEATAGRAPWVSGSIVPANHGRMLDFMGMIVEWIALRLVEADGEWRVDIDDAPLHDLFRQNPGVYEQLTHTTKIIRNLGIDVADAIELRKQVGVRALFLWLWRQTDG